MRIKLTQIAAATSLVVGLSFGVAFGASTTATQSPSTGMPTTSSTTTPPTATETGTATIPMTNNPATSAPTPTTPSTSTTPSPTSPPSPNSTTTQPAPSQTITVPGSNNTTVPSNPTPNSPSQIYVNPSSGSSTTTPNGAPIVNDPQSTNITTGAPNATGTNINSQQTPVIPQESLITFSQKAALASFTYNYKDYAQNLQTMQSYFTKTGWESFNKALTASNNLDVVQKEKLSVSATLNGQAQITQQQQTATGQSWQVNVPIIVTYQNDKKQMVQQDLTVKLSIATVSTNENSNGIGITQFIAMPNTTTPAATTPAS